MRATVLLVLVTSACSPAPPATTSTPPQSAQSRPAPVDQTVNPPRLRIDGVHFVTGAGRPFDWRGITAFRLAEMIAHDREAEAIAYLDWARGQKLTVVRVLMMAKHLFQLSPGDGVKALPRLLTLAAERGLHVEVVALADTSDIATDMEGHVKAIGAIAAEYANALVEIANEPWHPTQDRRLHEPAFTMKLAALIPAEVPVALGSVEGNDGYAAAGYVTWHSPRSSADAGWAHVLATAGGAGLLRRWTKPVVSDEPIGAAEQFVPGRRDNEPSRFGAAAALTRAAGMAATFHYEGGLQGRIPAGKELECLTAWSAGLDAIPLQEGGQFLDAAATKQQLADAAGARGMFARAGDNQATLVIVDPPAAVKVEWKQGWQEVSRQTVAGVIVIRAVRSSA